MNTGGPVNISGADDGRRAMKTPPLPPPPPPPPLPPPPPPGASAWLSADARRPLASQMQPSSLSSIEYCSRLIQSLGVGWGGGGDVKKGGKVTQPRQIGFVFFYFARSPQLQTNKQIIKHLITTQTTQWEGEGRKQKQRIFQEG